MIAVASSPHTLQTPKPLWSEQNPAEWWVAVSASIKSVLEKAGVGGERVAAVGLTGQMHGLVLLDEAGNVLRPAILWNDQRTQSQCDEIHQRIGKEKFIQITGNVALTGFTAPKILWVQENEPDVFAKAKHVLLPKDYIRLKLTGEYAMDKADGAGTVLFDLKSRDWSAEVLDALGIDPSWMPRTFEGTEFTGHVTARSRCAYRTESWYARCGRRRRPGRAGGGCGRSGSRHCRADSWHERRDLCNDSICIDRTRRKASRVLSCGAGHVALHGRDAFGGGKSAMVSRYACA